MGRMSGCGRQRSHHRAGDRDGLAGSGIGPAQAPDGRDWVGKRVVQRFHGLELRETQSSESREPDRIEIYRVERVRDRWLWLEAEETKTSGWVLASQVIPVERAIEYFSDRARRNPDDPWCYLMRSKLWYDKGRLDRALADCNEVIRLVPDDAAGYSNRGVVWSEMKKQDNAIDDYTKAIEMNPRYSDAFLGRGTVCAEEGVRYRHRRLQRSHPKRSPKCRGLQRPWARAV